jgi:putative Holliday junction resolvase
VAISDPDGVLATPVAVIDRKDTKGDVEAVVDMIGQREVGKVIVGLPRAMNGSIGPQAEKVRGFVERLAAGTVVPIEFRDERLSTVSARRLLRDAATKKSRKKIRDDDIAAAIILQSYLDQGR